MLEHDLKEAKQAKHCAGTLFLDLSSAFDTIDSEILAQKFEEYGATSSVTQWIKSYLGGRHQTVVYQNSQSEIVDNNIGAPQGSILSPFLFLVLVSDMEECLLGMEGVKLISYADDTTIYACAKTTDEVYTPLRDAAEKILSFMHSSGLAANPDKTNFVLFGAGEDTPVHM